MDGENCACVLTLNPDITGLGVRVAFYIQILLDWIMSLIWHDSFVKNSRAPNITALALIIVSFIVLQTSSLSLLDGIVVSFITTMMIVFAIVSNSRFPALGNSRNTSQYGELAEESPDEKLSYTRWFMQYCFVIFWGAWCFNMWRDPAQFGLQGEAATCDTNYKVIIYTFTQVHATNPSVRNAALALVSIGFFIALLSLFVTLEQVLLPIFWLIGEEKKLIARDNRQKYENNPVEGIRLIPQVIAFGTFIFIIYATERTINLNDVNVTTSWSYGQTIPMILLLEQIMQLFSTDIKQKERAEGRREEDAAAHGGGPGFSLHTRTTNPNDANATRRP